MNIAAVVVTYHPDPLLLYKNIKAFADHVAMILYGVIHQMILIIWMNGGKNNIYGQWL